MADPLLLDEPFAELLQGIAQCATCGVEYDAASVPAICPVCADERQYLPPDGVQRWHAPTVDSAGIEVVELEERLFALRVDGGVGIGQEAKVLVTGAGNVMVDVPAAITADAVAQVATLGPMRAIIPSHPHMFALQSAWSAALDGAEVWIARADAGWLGRAPEHLRLWDEEETVLPGVVATQLGGHFPGSAVIHWEGDDGRGVLLSGDTIAPNPDGRTTTFMYSYPNRIPLSGPVALRIADGAARFAFDRLYGNFAGSILSGAREAVLDSAARHAAWTSGDHDDLTRPAGMPG